MPDTGDIVSGSPTERFRRADAVFDAALDLSGPDQLAFVDRACGEDAGLRAEVLALLRAHDRSENFLDRAAVPIAALIADAAAKAGGPSDVPREGARRIGPYRVLRELGRGGMGVVYLAERDDGQYRQRVAVKVLRASPDTDELHRRFRAERQILASLSHPHIAQLLDGGVSDDQLPYLVIEYVDGVPITEYCDRHRLDVDARLRLFADVCAAVHHAHQNLVLHRDLKPGNVLVTPPLAGASSASGQVKLLDFGIAKLLNPTLGGPDQPVTRTAFRLMTPAYASPEQVRGDSLTTASDVYALGLLLYELLVGRPAHQITTDSPRAVFEVVCEREPERPSTGARRDAAAATARDTTPERLSRRLRGDLDAIVATALRKEPGRRYGSAELLAADVRRYLDGLPVLARPGSGWYRFEKLLRRHRAAAAFAAASLLLLVVGAGVALRLASQAARERDRAAAALAETRGALRESEEVTAFLVGLFEASDPAEGRLDTLTAANLLRRGAARAERLGAEPLAQARMLEALGRVNTSRGDFAAGADLLRRALLVRRAQLGAGHAATASAGAHLAEVLRWQGHYATADTLAREALRVRRLALGDSHPDVAASLRQVAGLAVYLGNPSAAEAYQREAVALARRGGPRGRGGDSVVALDLERLGAILWRRGDQVGAERALREALALTRRAFPDPHGDRAFAMLRLADVLDGQAATRAEAESLYRAALAEARAAFGDTHAETAQAMKQLGLALAEHGQRAEGERLVRQALAVQRRVLGASHREVTNTMESLGRMLSRDGYSAEAEQLYRAALVPLAASLGTSHAAYAGALSLLGDVLALRGALDSAEALQRRAVAIRVASIGAEQTLTALTALQLADVLTRRRRFAEADSVYRWALAVIRRRTTDTHVDVRRTYAGMASLYEVWGKRDSATRYRRLAAP